MLSFGVSTFTRPNGELSKMMTGIEMVHVCHRGAGAPIDLGAIVLETEKSKVITLVRATKDSDGSEQQVRL